MRSSFGALSLLCACVLAGITPFSIALADELPAKQPDQIPDSDVAAPASLRLKHNFLTFALDVSRFNYAEDFPPPGKSTENGTLPGFFLSYTHQNGPPYVDAGFYWTALMEYSPGGTHYDGTTQAPNYTPVQQDTSNQFFRAEGDMGFSLVCFSHEADSGCLKLYGGLGARLWTRGVSNTNNGVQSPSEHYSWLYLPIGARVEKQLGESWTIGLDASLRWMFAGGIVVKFTDFPGYYEDGEGSLGSKWTPGVRLELPIQYKISRTISIETVPWFEYSSIGQGDTFDVDTADGTLEGYEPASRTYQYGARFGVVYGF